MAMKMFMNMKLTMMKDLSERIEKADLMTDDLKKFFDKEFEDIKDNSKLMSKSLNKLNKKRMNASSSESDSDSTGSNKKMKKEKKEKRPPTEHQTRVSKCMVVLKERYAQVKHQIRLGTANYMASYIKNEFSDIDFETDTDKVEQALTVAMKKMNEKKGEEVYSTSCETSTSTDEKKKEDEQKDAQTNPSSSKTKKVEKVKKNGKVKKDEKIEKIEKIEKVEEESNDKKKDKMDDLLKELEEMNNESESEEEESDDEE